MDSANKLEDGNILYSINLLDQLLKNKAFDYIDEITCQNQMEIYFNDLGLKYYREYRLDKSNKIDFFFPVSGIGLEVKAAKLWSKREVYRQLERYSKFDCIKGIILATGRSQGLPKMLNGVPLWLHHMGATHL